MIQVKVLLCGVFILSHTCSITFSVLFLGMRFIGVPLFKWYSVLGKQMKKDLPELASKQALHHTNSGAHNLAWQEGFPSIRANAWAY